MARGPADPGGRLGGHMSASRGARTRVTVIAATALSIPISLLAGTPAQAAPGYDRTSAREAQRVDRVPTPKLDWFDCAMFRPGADCASVDLPLDYDHPRGPKTSVAVLRIKATDQQHRVGTLFLNPGGPGGSGVEMAAAAPYFLGPDLLARFDIVGFDPRGTNYSDNVRCWRNPGEQADALSGLLIPFPWTPEETRAFVAGSRAFGRACSTTGRPLSGSMSTAEVARDMEMLRRGVGDRQLSYLGFSYGSYLGQVYANMFPDRVRALVIDGVLDPVAWAGTPATAGIPQTIRIRSGEGGARALREILHRCGKAGPDYCSFASAGDPGRNYRFIVASLKKAPLVVNDPEYGSFTFSYADLTSNLLGMLYYPEGSSMISDMLDAVYTLLQPPAPLGTPAAARQAQARTALAKIQSERRTRAGTAKKSGADPFGNRFGFPYDNSLEATESVLCTDGLNPPDAALWPAYANAADRLAPQFGRLWTWASAPCASRTWTVRDEDRYAGPFTHRTAHPVLVVGNYWDPATNYAGAVKASRLLPNSRLLRSNSWGHTAYGTSACVTSAVDGYLVTGTAPAPGTRCFGDAQPFTTPLLAPSARASSTGHRAPVAPMLPSTPQW